MLHNTLTSYLRSVPSGFLLCSRLQSVVPVVNSRKTGPVSMLTAPMILILICLLGFSFWKGMTNLYALS